MKQLLFSFFTFSLTISTIQAQTQPYQNPNLSAHERAVDLCSMLTLEEKALLIRFGQLKWDVYDYKFVRDGLEQLLNSYRRYIVLENVE